MRGLIMNTQFHQTAKDKFKSGKADSRVKSAELDTGQL